MSEKPVYSYLNLRRLVRGHNSHHPCCSSAQDTCCSSLYFVLPALLFWFHTDVKDFIKTIPKHNQKYKFVLPSEVWISWIYHMINCSSANPRFVQSRFWIGTHSLIFWRNFETKVHIRLNIDSEFCGYVFGVEVRPWCRWHQWKVLLLPTPTPFFVI